MPSLQSLAYGLLLFPITLTQADNVGAVQYSRDGRPDDPGLAHYVSRPDLQAPIWDFTIHHEELNSPGYWFVAPYRGINGEQSNESWVGPFIYDGENAELIWSGGLDFDSSNVADFRISNVNGEPLMTLFANNQIMVLNDDYTVRVAKALEAEGNLNTHEMNFVENGTRAIFLKNHMEKASREESQSIGYDGECVAKFDGIIEMDVTQDDWPRVFDWNPHGRIGLDESTHIFPSQSLEDRCKGWDYLHANSVDKTPEGDYLFSVRHTNTIYKVSGKDGSILWRLGGIKNDFHSAEDVGFSRQHDLRYRGQNSTHLWISILDNSKGEDPQPPTHDFSRGLLLAIDETQMVVTLEAHYDHPYHEQHALVQRRGNYQLLPNGNIFMGWSERAVQSEHTPDGKLIWEAILQVDWMGSYRNYKFDGFVGRPVEPPTAVSRAYEEDGETVTVVHVSWNGATEVAAWKLFRTSPDGESHRVLIATEAKIGFETELYFDGFARYVVIEAIDQNGKRIGNTSAIATVAEASISADVVVEEEQWLRDLEESKVHRVSDFGKIIAAFCAGAVCGIVALLGVWQARQQGPNFFRTSFGHGHRYTAVSQEQSNGALLPLQGLQEDVNDPELAG